MQQPFLLHASTKKDGNMSLTWGKDREQVLAHRKRWLERYGMGLKDCVVMAVEHEERVLMVDASHTQKHAEEAVTAEAFITQTPGVVLFLLTADCLPIALYDPAKKALALAHLGWRPTEKQLLPKVIQSMQQAFGSEPKNLLVHIGPGIHKESYRHTLPLKGKEELVVLKPFITPVTSNEVSIDLVGCNTSQLLALGVRQEHIHVDPTDTAVSSKYFSHYRSVRTREQEGRFATIAYLR